jgi:hypothetical protein
MVPAWFDHLGSKPEAMTNKQRIVSAVSWQPPIHRLADELGGKAVGLLDAGLPGCRATRVCCWGLVGATRSVEGELWKTITRQRRKLDGDAAQHRVWAVIADATGAPKGGSDRNHQVMAAQASQ